ncbi:MAG: histidine phosphatase family protein [Microbacteriaceae bacterium]|nr:histidine phosphatase family protein [Microbacteriaceae bacterium]
MPAELLHLVRHGEVENPDGILYGRIPGFALSERGARMAALAAASLEGRPVNALIASPLQRTRESAAPWASAFSLPVTLDERIIEPWNRFEGSRMREAVMKPRNWPLLLRPRVPSWGEPYVEVRDRMLAAMDEAWDEADGGEVVLVSHQMPIWTTTLAVNGRRLHHDPRKRRTALSSITSFRRDEASSTGWVEVGYQEPAAGLLAEAVDTGAV